MVTVYFETDTQSEKVAIFESKYPYEACRAALEEYAATIPMKVVARQDDNWIWDLAVPEKPELGDDFNW